MNRNFTQLTFSDINTCDIDLIADAYGYLFSLPADFEAMLKSVRHTPGDRVIDSLMDQIPDL